MFSRNICFLRVILFRSCVSLTEFYGPLGVCVRIWFIDHDLIEIYCNMIPINHFTENWSQLNLNKSSRCHYSQWITIKSNTSRCISGHPTSLTLDHMFLKYTVLQVCRDKYCTTDLLNALVEMISEAYTLDFLREAGFFYQIRTVT